MVIPPITWARSILFFSRFLIGCVQADFLSYGVLMTNEELVELIRNSSQGEDRKELMATLYNKNRNLIAMIARRYTGLAEFQDLMQEAFFGLLAAVESFDLKGDVAFSTYLGNAVAWTLHRYINAYGNPIRVPENQRMKIFHYQRICEKIEKLTGRKPNDYVAAYYLGMSVDQIRELKADQKALYVESISKCITGAEDDLTIEGTIQNPVDEMEDTLERIEGEQLQRFLWRKVDDLGEREAVILRRRFQEQKSLADVSKELGISVERIRQIQAKLIKKLRNDKSIRDFIDDRVESISYHNSGLAPFRHSFTSSPESAAIFREHMERMKDRNVQYAVYSD